MQIVIDISEDVYTRLFDNGIQDNEIAVDDVCEMAMAIRKGTPLDKCKECKKDWTKCGRCLVTMEWVKERQAYDKGFDDGLEQGLKIGEPCEDCISREEVMHCIDNRGGNYYFNLREQIKKLPSVTPAEKQEPCDDCVSRQEAIKPFIVDATEEWTSADVIKHLKSLPSVTPTEKPNKWIDAEVLDKIRTEIVHLHDWAFSREEILRILDKYKAESER